MYQLPRIAFLCLSTALLVQQPATELNRRAPEPPRDLRASWDAHRRPAFQRLQRFPSLPRTTPDAAIELLHLDALNPLVFCRATNWIAADAISDDDMWPKAGSGSGFRKSAADIFGMWNAGAVLGTNERLVGRVQQMDALHSILAPAPELAGTGSILHVPAQYPTIQGAISAAFDGDTVLVAPGVYLETLDFLGKKITVESEHGPSVTTIDGQALGPVVKFVSGENLNSVLRGFSITNGSQGVYAPNASIVIEGNRVFGNHSYGSGGGGLSVGGNSRVLNNWVFSNSTTDAATAGIAVHGSGTPSITGNTVYGNRSGARPAGISSPGVITNCIVWGNSPTTGQVNGAATYSDIEGGHPGTGNISADPRFVAPLSGDLHISSYSPCVDRGNNAAPHIPAVDIDGEPRIANGTIDMGADETRTAQFLSQSRIPVVRFDLVGGAISAWGGLDPTYESRFGGPWLDSTGGFQSLTPIERGRFVADVITDAVSVIRLNPTFWANGKETVWQPSSQELGWLQSLAGAGCAFHFVVHSPPADYKTNRNLQGGKLDQAFLAAYAADTVQMMEHLQGNGVPLWSFSLQNEPDFAPPWPSCVYSPQEYVDAFKAIATAIRSSPALAQVLLMAPSTSSVAPAQPYIDALYADPTAWTFVDIISVHLYRDVDGLTGEVLRAPVTYGKPWLVDEWNWESAGGLPANPADRVPLSTAALVSLITEGACGFMHWRLLCNNEHEPPFGSSRNLKESMFTADTGTGSCGMGIFCDEAKQWLGYKAIFANVLPGSVWHPIDGRVRDELRIFAATEPSGVRTVVVANLAPQPVTLNLLTPGVSSWTTATGYYLDSESPATVPPRSDMILGYHIPNQSVLAFRGQ